MLVCDTCSRQLACITNQRWRYYTCLRSMPCHAERLMRPLHSFPRVPAEALEAEARNAVARLLGSREQLAIRLEQTRREHDAATER